LRIGLALELGDAIAQCQPALLQAAQQKLIDRLSFGQPIDGGIEIGVIDAQIDQLARGKMEVGVQGVASAAFGGLLFAR